MARWNIGVALGLVVAVTIAKALQSAGWALIVTEALVLIGGLVLLATLVLSAAFVFALYEVGSWYEQRQSCEPIGDCGTDAALIEEHARRRADS